MKKRNIMLAILVALLVIGGTVAYTKQPEMEPTMSEVEASVEQPVETLTETPVEGDTAVEGDETSATGNLGGSAGENNFGMTNLMDSIKDNDQTDVEHSLDLEEERQETPIEGTVGSDVGSGNSAGTQTGVPSGNDGSGTGNSNGSGNGNNQLSTEEQQKLKDKAESDEAIAEVGDYIEDIGGWEITTDTGREQVMLPGGAFLDEELLDILRQYGK